MKEEQDDLSQHFLFKKVRQRRRRREELLEELRVGEVRYGTVRAITDFGVIIDLGGADGLVHRSQLSWNSINHPSEVVHVGQEVEVLILEIDKEKKKIMLSVKYTNFEVNGELESPS
ncbi:MAG: S1 RNA-binding domain-containing protein [Chloroflexota bacterium]|nr:S1 RNA-binding domain-containing protein [Chloroflexota bacterium]